MTLTQQQRDWLIAQGYSEAQIAALEALSTTTPQTVYDSLTQAQKDALVKMGVRVPGVTPTTPLDTLQKSKLQDMQETLLTAGFTTAQVNDLIENVIKPGLLQGLSAFDIMARLRETETYKQAYPEWHQRIENGYDAWSEAEIRQYRDRAKQMAKSIYGADITNDDIAKLISNNVSVEEFGHRLEIRKQVDIYGPAVKDFFANQLGMNLDDAGLEEFFDPEVDTADWDEAYQSARYRAAPTAFGFAVRPEEEMNLLRQYGVDVDQAFKGYQEIAGSLSSAERWNTIDRALGTVTDLPSDGSGVFNSTPFSTLFRGIQLGDPEALKRLREAMQRDVARNTQGGGAVFKGTAAESLLTPGGI